MEGKSLQLAHGARSCPRMQLRSSRIDIGSLELQHECHAQYESECLDLSPLRPFNHITTTQKESFKEVSTEGSSKKIVKSNSSRPRVINAIKVESQLLEAKGRQSES